jgi:hypothetical protein
MNFCKDCKYCVKHWSYWSGADLEYYCKMPCTPRYDYITGTKITTTYCECISIRQKNQSSCEYFEPKPEKWYKKIIKKL